MPMPAITAAVEPAPWCATFGQSVFAARWTRTSTENSPKRYVAYVLHFRTALMPSPEIANVATTNPSSITRSSAPSALMPNMTSRTVSIA
jgi:hypothetical protein